MLESGSRRAFNYERWNVGRRTMVAIFTGCPRTARWCGIASVGFDGGPRVGLLSGVWIEARRAVPPGADWA